VLTAIKKRLLISESHDDLNQCTSCRENLIHTTRTLLAPVHVRHLYTSCGQSMYMTTFRIVINSVEQGHCSREKGTLNYIPSTPTDESVGPHPISLPSHPLKQWGQSQVSGDNWLHRFTRHISPTCDQYVQYLLTGSTHRSLTDTDGGYNLGGANFLHHSPRPS
jgi:hypothetical protein